jgi:UDP-glucose:(heptosyl)LPS alpha-1,3-glucosyltransferase
MRFAIVRQQFHSDGAVERVTERALEALLERNVAVSLYTRSWPQTRLQLVEPAICNPFYAGALWRDWGFARAACRMVRQTKPSLVEAHERILCCDIYRAVEGVHAVWLEERRTQASFGERSAIACSPRNRYLLRMEERLYASPWLRAVICGSRMVRDEIRGRYAVPEAKLQVIYDPVDGAHFHPGLRADRPKVLERHRINAKATVFVTVADDFARCGVATALGALAAVSAPAHLVVVGDDPHLERYRRQARALGIADRVTFAGRQTDRRPWYGAADAFVLPALYEPSPGAALEAMACALPVVTSTKCGAAELVREHEGGLACASGDVAALAAHLRTLQDATARARFGAQARRAVLPLSPAATTRALVLLYRDLLAAATAAVGQGAPHRGADAQRTGV